MKREAIVLYTSSNMLGKDYIALEIMDGFLYLVYNLGAGHKREKLSEDVVSDGAPHKASY